MSWTSWINVMMCSCLTPPKTNWRYVSSLQRLINNFIAIRDAVDLAISCIHPNVVTFLQGMTSEHGNQGFSRSIINESVSLDFWDPHGMQGYPSHDPGRTSRPPGRNRHYLPTKSLSTASQSQSPTHAFHFQTKWFERIKWTNWLPYESIQPP